MPVHRRALFRVVLDYHIFLIPEHIFDEAHLAPVRGTVTQSN
jgi:hypothetical protein